MANTSSCVNRPSPEADQICGFFLVDFSICVAGAFLTSTRYLCLHWAMTMKNRKLFCLTSVFCLSLLRFACGWKGAGESVAQFPLPCFFGWLQRLCDSITWQLLSQSRVWCVNISCTEREGLNSSRLPWRVPSCTQEEHWPVTCFALSGLQFLLPWCIWLPYHSTPPPATHTIFQSPYRGHTA